MEIFVEIFLATHQYLPHISISSVTPAGPIVAQKTSGDSTTVQDGPWGPWIEDLPSGKLTISYWKLPLTVSFPIKNGGSSIVFCMFTRGYPLKMTNFHSYVKFPEGMAAFSMTHKPNWYMGEISPPSNVRYRPVQWWNPGWWFQTWLDYFPYYIIWEVGCGWIFYSWLVISNMTVYFPFHIWHVVLPIDELIFFRGIGQPPTRWHYMNSYSPVN